MPLIHVGGGKFVDKDPLDLDQIRDAAPHELFPGMEKYKIYAWVEFYSLERAGYGLQATKGKPDDPIVESIETREQGFDPSTISPLTELDEVVSILKERKGYLVAEFPFSEITTEKDYNRALAACLNIPSGSVKDWSPRDKQRIKDESAWKGPGVYDMRDCSPTKHADSVEEYELEGMEFWADDTLEFMFQGDEWKESLMELIERLSEL